MEQDKYKQFARLLECIISEASTGVDLVKRNAGGAELLRHVHKSTPLPHDVEWQSVQKVPWSDIKGKGGWRKKGGGWIIFLGSKGTGAIYADMGGDYTVYASNGRPGDTDAAGLNNRLLGSRTSSGGEALKRVKDITGPIRSIFMAKRAGEGEIEKKREKRAELRKAMAPATVRDVHTMDDATASSERLLRKFKPVWEKAMVQAMADIKGFLNLQIKNDAYHKVDKRLRRLQQIDNWLNALRDGDDISSNLKHVLLHAVDLAARHHFPDQVPDDFYMSGRSYGPLPEGIKLLLNGISSGDTRLLSTVLYFFKKGLLSA